MREENNNNKRRALGMGLEQLFNSEMLDFDQVENKKGWYAPKLYIDCDGEVTIYVFDEGNNVYFLHGTGLNYDDFEQFTEINERRGET